MSGDRQAKVTLTGDAAGITAAAQQGEKALSGVGSAADQVAAKLAAASAAAAAYGKTSEEVGRKAAGSAAGIAAGTRAMDAAGMSAKQTAMAWRQLPMQMQDVAVSLAGGMNPLLVMAQQGPQITQAFGGVTETFKAMASVMSPLRLAVGGLAIAFAATAAGAVQGYRESQAYTDAITMTGNAAGVTLGKLNEMAQRATALGVSQAAAADALAKATASGRIGAENLEQVGVLAVRMERNVGLAVDQTIKAFVELAKKPAEASRALNEQYNYLDAATYKRIAALEEQKRMEEAAALAQTAFADAMDDRMGRIEGNLGTLEKAWRGITKVAGDAWSAMMGLGRAQTTEDRISELGELLAKSRGEFGGSWDKWIAKNLDLRNPAQKAAMEDRLQQEQYALQERQRLERLSATSEAATAAANREAVRKTDEDAKEARRRAEEARRQAEQAARQAARDAEQERKARRDAEVAGLLEGGRTRAAAIEQEARLVEAARAAGTLSEEQAYQRRRELMRSQTGEQIRALEAQNQALVGQQLKGAEAVKRDQEVARNREEIVRLWTRGATDLQVAAAAEEQRLQSLARATAAYSAELQAMQDLQARQYSRELQVFGQGDQARDRAARRSSIDERYDEDLRRLNADRASRKLPEAEYDQRLGALQEYYREALGMEATYQVQRAALQGRADLGFNRAWENWSDTARNVYSQVEAAATRAFDGIADSFVSLAVTGKGNFSALAESVMADILRMVIRAQMLKVFEGLFGGSGGAGGFFNAAFSAVKGYFGGGGVQDSYTGAPVFHGGGVVGRDAPFSVRTQPANAWNNAPRFHSGLATDEVRAILKKNEGVFTPEQMKQLAPVGAVGAAPRVDIRLINESGTPLQAAETRQRSDGGFDVILRAAESQIADRIGAGEGPVVGALRSRFGLRDALV